MNRRQFLRYSVSASAGTSAGFFLAKFFQLKDKNPPEKFRAYFRVRIYSEEWLKEKESQITIDIMRQLGFQELSSIDFCFNSSYFGSADLYKEDEILAENISSGASYIYISPREIGEVKYSLVLKNKKSEEKIMLPIIFKENMELMAIVSKAKKIGDDETSLLEDYLKDSKGYPQRAWICRREQVEYEINGLEAIAETSPENLKKYFESINSYGSYDDFLLKKRN